jgi:hypothetical protein
MKLNSVVYNKLILQAEEAKELGLTKLASNILNSVGSFPDDSLKEYSYEEMSDDIEQDLWKAATRVINYYKLNSVQAEKLDDSINVFSEKLIKELKETLNANDSNTLEPKLLGQNK